MDKTKSLFLCMLHSNSKAAYMVLLVKNFEYLLSSQLKNFPSYNYKETNYNTIWIFSFSFFSYYIHYVFSFCPTCLRTTSTKRYLCIHETMTMYVCTYFAVCLKIVFLNPTERNWIFTSQPDILYEDYSVSLGVIFSLNIDLI